MFDPIEVSRLTHGSLFVARNFKYRFLLLHHWCLHVQQGEPRCRAGVAGFPAWLELLPCLLLSSAPSLALPPSACCAACLHYSAACCACCCCRWLCCRCHFDCWMLLFFYSGSTTPQVSVEMLQQRRTLVPSIRSLSATSSNTWRVEVAHGVAAQRRPAWVALQLRSGPLAHGAARWRRAQLTTQRTAWRRGSQRRVGAQRERSTQQRAPAHKGKRTALRGELRPRSSSSRVRQAW
jgi:hypothetical protein